MQTATPSVCESGKNPDRRCAAVAAADGGGRGVDSLATCCRSAGYDVAEATVSPQVDGASES